ncbi:hypothetical protein ABNX05_25150 [Lysinibacillus sp. M3]|uniref:Uncharacterized protein n=1 Tax=Lysinibacillus zambalensis TaxID=3160866 RepID=A0ABV1N309_9BACI
MKKLFHLMIIAFIGVFFIYGLTNIILNLKGYNMADFLIAAVMLVFVALLELVLIKQYNRIYSLESIKAQKQIATDKEKAKFEIESKILGSKSRQQLIGADLCIKAKHMAGLPIAEGAEMFVYRCKGKVVFERNQDTIELGIDKVKDILIKTDVEIQKSYVSSAGGAVGGYVLFGPLGAMIGGRTKEKKSTNIEKYLIFSYEKDGDTAYISMEVTNEPNASLFNTNYYDLSKNERKLTSL